MNNKYQMFGWWSGIAFFLLFWLACVSLAGFVPPPSPTLSGQELLEIYKGNIFGIRLGMMLALIAAVLLIPWSATLSLLMARIEGPQPMMSITAFGAGVANAVAFYLPFVFWAAGTYRLDRAPELVQLISDMSWLEFVMLYAPFGLQTVAIAVVGLSDKSSTPTFPRWFCFLSFWTTILIVPGGFALFFYTGPFAWNGLFAFWVPVVVFCIYYTALFWLAYKALKRQSASA